MCTSTVKICLAVVRKYYVMCPHARVLKFKEREDDAKIFSKLIEIEANFILEYYKMSVQFISLV